VKEAKDEEEKKESRGVDFFWGPKLCMVEFFWDPHDPPLSLSLKYLIDTINYIKIYFLIFCFYIYYLNLYILQIQILDFSRYKNKWSYKFRF